MSPFDTWFFGCLIDCCVYGLGGFGVGFWILRFWFCCVWRLCLLGRGFSVDALGFVGWLIVAT